METTATTQLLIVVSVFIVISGFAAGVAFVFARRLQLVLRRHSNWLVALTDSVNRHDDKLSGLIGESRDQSGRGRTSDIVLEAMDTYENLDQNWQSMCD